MNILDIILAGTIIYGTIRGLSRGFVVEVVALLSLALGIYAAINFSGYLTSYMSMEYDWDSKNISVASFVICFFFTMLMVGFISNFVSKMLEKANLGGVNRFFGACFGLLKWAFITGTILTFLNRSFIQIIPEQSVKESKIHPWVTSISDKAFDYVFPKKDEK